MYFPSLLVDIFAGHIKKIYWAMIHHSALRKRFHCKGASVPRALGAPLVASTVHEQRGVQRLLPSHLTHQAQPRVLESAPLCPPHSLPTTSVFLSLYPPPITLSKVAEGECRAAPRQLTKVARGSLRNPVVAAGLAPRPSAPLSPTPPAPTLLQAPCFPTEVTAQDGRRAAHPQVMPGARQVSRLHQVTLGNVCSTHWR